MNQLLKHPTLLQELTTHNPSYGILKGFDANGYPQVSITVGTKTSLITAESICELSHSNIDKKVLISFVEGDIQQSVILGCIKAPLITKQIDKHSLFNDKDIEDIEIISGLSSIKLKPTGRIEIKGIELDLTACGNVSINGEKVLLNCDKDTEQ